MRSCLIAIILPALCYPQTWVLQPTETKSSLRGLQTVGPKTIWASGTGGSWVRSTDGGSHWVTGTVPGTGELDFRGLHFFNNRTGLLMSSGTGDKSRIYRTLDSGAHWKMVYSNPDPTGFYDAIKFWDTTNGIVVGDPVDGKWTILTTNDSGLTWQRMDGPAAVPNEGAFAASNSCLQVRGAFEAWFATGGPSGARIFHSTDRGKTWTVSPSNLRNDLPGAGAFSLAFDGPTGVAVVGLYSEPGSSIRNWAISEDAGMSWTVPVGPSPTGYRSAVAFLPKRKAWVAVGTNGTDIAEDGWLWKRIDTGAFHALSVSPSGDVWASGPEGRIAKLEP